MTRPYDSAAEHTRDELALVGLFVSRALARGRTEGWIDDGSEAYAVDEALVLNKFREIEERLAATPEPLPMDLLRRRLGLSLTEQRVLWTLIGFELDPRVRRLLRHVATEDGAHVTVGTLISVVYDDMPGAGYAELATGGRLFEHRLVDVSEGGPVSQRHIRAIDRVLELASGIVRLDRDVERFARLESPRPLGAFIMSLDALDETMAALSRGFGDVRSPLVVAVGPDGSGRRSLIQAAAARAGRPLLLLNVSDLPVSTESCDCALRSAYREAVVFDACLLLIGLDELEGDAGARGLRQLESCGLSAMPQPSFAIMKTERPLTFSRGVTWLRVPGMRDSERHALWARELATSASTELVSDIAARYLVTGGVIVAAAEQARQRAITMGRTVGPADVHEAVRGEIESRLGDVGTRIVTTQGWADVVLPEDTLDEVKEMIARVKHRRRVLEEWGFAEKLERGLGISALFYGAPGTGKTMVAGLIARELGLDLYQVDLSRIVSKWVGETEKNLSSLFSAAESGHAVILFDEADSLFAKRTDVKSSNDRYANLEVNYLLQRMESFAGITILTTNHDSAIDEAFRRRLSFRIEFPIPEADERQRIWRAVLPARAALGPDVNFEVLAERYEMTGGYIRNAVLRAAFFAASTGSSIRDAHLRRAAALELSAMGKVVGGRHA